MASDILIYKTKKEEK